MRTDTPTLLANASAGPQVTDAMIDAFADADTCRDFLRDNHTFHCCRECIRLGLEAALAATRHTQGEADA